MDPNVIDLLQKTSMAVIEVGNTIVDLGARADDDATPEAEKAEIAMQLPGLRLNKHELEARQAGLAAEAETMNPPGDEVLQGIADATTTLANATASRSAVSVIVGAVGQVMAAVPRPSGG